MPKYAHLANVI